MVVPGTVVAGRNRGGHQLIRDGAALVETAEDVLAVLVAAVPPLRGERERAAHSAGEGRATLRGDAAEPAGRRDAPSAAEDRASEDPVWAALDPVDGQDLDALTARTGLSGPAVLVRLAELELAGLVARQPGARFVRSAGMV
jgi:DNA processing protein